MRARMLFGIGVLALATGFSSPAAMAAQLFTPATAAEQAARTPSPEKTTKRQRLVHLDAKALGAAILPSGMDSARDRADRSATLSGKITITLFNDIVADFERSSVETSLAGGIVWRGQSKSGHVAILVVNDNAVTGSVERDGRHFLIEPLDSGSLHRIREIDTEAYPRDLHVEPPVKPRKNTTDRLPETTQSRAPAPTEVTLLAVYTAKAKSRLGTKFQDKITLDVGKLNTALTNSGVNMRIRIVGFKAVSSGFNEQSLSSYGAQLDAITSGNTFNFANIREARTTLGADLVTMYTVRDEFCGLAWVNHPTPIDDFAFSVISTDCQGTLALAHEAGHNMGLKHDRFVEAAAPNSQYNFGHVDTLGRFRDIMSYPDKCSAQALVCREVSYFSTPLKTISGRPLGIAQFKKGAADAARVLREFKAQIAAFR